MLHALWPGEITIRQPHVRIQCVQPCLRRYACRGKVTIDIPSHKTARSGLAQCSAVSITNTGGKGSRRKGKEELRGHCALIASPQFLVAVRVGLPVTFVCNETHEQGEELLVSYRYQVHLLHWLESNVCGVFQSENDLYIKVKRMVYISDRSDFEAGRSYCAAQLLETRRKAHDFRYR